MTLLVRTVPGYKRLQKNIHAPLENESICGIKHEGIALGGFGIKICPFVPRMENGKIMLNPDLDSSNEVEEEWIEAYKVAMTEIVKEPSENEVVVVSLDSDGISLHEILSSVPVEKAVGILNKMNPNVAASILDNMVGAKTAETANGILNELANKEEVLEGISKTSMAHMDALKLLDYKKQIVLQGPPGTGKTYMARKIAEELTGTGQGQDSGCRWDMVQFHPSYNYEDFIRGIQVSSDENGHPKYGKEDRIFVQMCEKSEKDKEKKYVLIIDEMNRANLPSVLGELINGLEYRGVSVQTPYGPITVPENLLVIGTMNTADRSIGHIDYAIRRRFAFIDILPDETRIPKEAGKEYFRAVASLFTGEMPKLSPEYQAQHVQIGHSYFIADEKGMELRMEYEVKPILREYAQDGILRVSDEEIETVFHVHSSEPDVQAEKG